MNLRRNLGYKILSLALGILLYATAEAQRNPQVSEFMQVAPKAENVPANMALREEPGSVSVTVTGSASAIQAFRRQASKAIVDLRNAKTGVNHLPIRYQNNPATLDVVGPLLTDVKLENKARMPFDVDVLYNDAPPPGLLYNDPVTLPKTVAVTGLASDVSRVDRVVAIVDNDESGVVRRSVEVVAQNTLREVIDGVQIVPSKVLVTISTRKTPATKSLVLSPELEGEPEPGYMLIDCRVEPRTLTVRGTPQVLSRLSALNVPVRLDKLESSQVRQVPPSLPPGVTLDEDQPRTVRLRIEIRPVPVAATPLPVPSPVPTATPVPAPTPEATPSPLERNP